MIVKPNKTNRLARRRTLHSLSAMTFGLCTNSFSSQAYAQQGRVSRESVVNDVRRLVAGKAVELRMLIPTGSGANIAPLARAFETDTGVAIRVVETSVDSVSDKLALDAMVGQGSFDLALPATFAVPDLVSSEAIIALDGYADRYESDDLRDGILYGTGDSFDGRLYGFQTDGDSYLMFYHKEMLESATEKGRYEDKFGEPLAVPQTWAQLDQQIAFFHRPEIGQYGGLLFRTPGYLAWEWWVRFHSKGVWPFSSSLAPQIASDAGVEALEEMIRVSQYLAPEVSRLGLFDNWARFARGDTYCNIGWGGSQKYLNGPDSAMRGRMSYGSTPGGLIDGELLTTPYFNWGWNYVVTSSSTQPELAYLFALFASTIEMSTIAVRERGGYFDPYRPEHYDDPEIADIYSQSFLDVHRQSMSASIPDLYLAGQGEYFHTLNVWLDKALSGQATPEFALNRAAQQWELISKQSGVERQRERWLQLREKYPADVRKRLRDLPTSSG